MDPKNVMEETGKHNKIFTSFNTPFSNSQCLFIEYDDVIKCPSFVLLMLIQDNEEIKKIFDLSPIIDLSIEELYEWYLRREDINIFRNFKLVNGALETYFDNDEIQYQLFLDTIIEKEYNALPDVITTNSTLNFGESLTLVGDSVKRIIVYNPFDSPVIRDDLESTYGNKVTFVTGDLFKVIKENHIPSDSTFVFSDITKIYDVKEAGILCGASILIADKYKYNYNAENEPIIDFKDVLAEDYCRIDFFDNISKPV